jgi:hypothetical protein
MSGKTVTPEKEILETKKTAGAASQGEYGKNQ